MMSMLMSKLFSLSRPYYRVSQYLAKRQVHEEKFPATRLNLNRPNDYLIVLPETLNESPEVNELLRIPKAGEPEIDFSKITLESLFKGFSKTICSYENFIIDFTNSYNEVPTLSFHDFLKELESHLYPMDCAHSILYALMNVRSDDFNHDQLNQLIGRYIKARGQIRTGALEEAFKFYQSNNYKSLSDVDKKILNLHYSLVNNQARSVTKPDDDYALITHRNHVGQAASMFRYNVQESNKLFSHTVDDPDILSVVSSDFDDCLGLHHKERTPLKVTVSTYKRFMEICPDRFVRRGLWEALNKRCSPKSTPRLNNTDLITTIRIGRRKIANLMGYRTHVDRRLDNAMAKSRQQILENLKKLNQENLTKLDDRLQELNEFAADNSFEDPESLGIQAYDIDFWLNKYKYDIMIGKSEAELKSYFPLPVVMNGLLKFFNDYFQVEFKENKNLFKKLWSEDLKVYEVNRGNETIGTIIYDPHQRSDKLLQGPFYGHLRNRNLDAGTLPVRLLSTPFKLNPATNLAHLSMDDIMNIFFSFGMIIQQLLYKYKYYELNTVGALEVDAENLLPNLCVSYLMKDHHILQSCSDRGSSKPIDTELSSRIIKASKYSEAFKLWQDLYLAHLDIELNTTVGDMDALVKSVYQTYSPFAKYPDDYDYCSMDEIFVGPNDGCLYANLWSKQLAEKCVQDGDIKSISNFNARLLDTLFDPENLDTSKKLFALGNINSEL